MPGNDSSDDMQAFVDEYGLAFPQAVTEDGSLWARFGVAYQPAWVFVDDSGDDARSCPTTRPRRNSSAPSTT